MSLVTVRWRGQMSDLFADLNTLDKAQPRLDSGSITAVPEESALDAPAPTPAPALAPTAAQAPAVEVPAQTPQRPAAAQEQEQ